MGCNSFKSIIVFLLTITILLALCACSLGANTQHDDKTSPTSESVTTQDVAPPLSMVTPEATAPTETEVLPEPQSVSDTTSEEAKALAEYSDFIMGNVSLSEDDMAKISIQGENPMSDPKGYALHDMNGDGIPELLIRSGNIYILTYKNESLLLWWSDRFWTGHSLILSNGAVLHMRNGAAPTHTSYQYLVLDNDGTEKDQVEFAKYDSDEDGTYDYFVFEGEDELSEDEWNQKVQPYLSENEIEWNEDLIWG